MTAPSSEAVRADNKPDNAPEQLWPDPIPLDVPGEPTPFPTESLPTWLAEWVAAEAEAVQVPADLPGVLALSVLSAASRGRYFVHINDSWREPVSLYTAVVAESAERKSAIVGQATEALYEWQTRYNETITSDLAHDQVQHRSLELQHKAAEKALEKAIDDAAKLSHTPDARRAKDADIHTAQIDAAEALERLNAHQPLVNVDLFAHDITPERVASLLVEQGERLAIIDAEGGIFSIMAGRYSDDANFDIFLKGHAADPHTVQRQKRKADALRHPMLTIGVGIQEDVLTSIGERRDFRGRGLLARFLYSLPTSMVGYRKVDPDPMPTHVRAAYNNRIAAIADKAERRPEPTPIPLSDEAHEVRRRFEQGHEDSLRDTRGTDDPLRPWLGKYVGATLRLAALLHLAENEGEPRQITAAQLRNAITLARYFRDHATRAFLRMDPHPVDRMATRIVDWTRRHDDDEVNERELKQAFKIRDSDRKKIEDFTAAINLLLGNHWLRPKPLGPASGRPPSATYYVHPRLRTGDF